MTLEGRWGGVREGGGWRVEEIVKRIALSNQAIANSLPAERLSRECTGKVKKDDFTEYWPRKKGSSLNSKNPNILTIIHRWRPHLCVLFLLKIPFCFSSFYAIRYRSCSFTVLGEQCNCQHKQNNAKCCKLHFCSHTELKLLQYSTAKNCSLDFRARMHVYIVSVQGGISNPIGFSNEES